MGLELTEFPLVSVVIQIINAAANQFAHGKFALIVDVFAHILPFAM